MQVGGQSNLPGKLTLVKRIFGAKSEQLNEQQLMFRNLVSL